MHLRKISFFDACMGMLTVCFWMVTVQLDAQSYSYRFFNTSDGLTNAQIRSMYKDSRGYLWLGTNRNFYFFDGKEFHTPPDLYDPTSSTVMAFAEDEAGNIWMGSPRGLGKYDGKVYTSYPSDTISIHTMVMGPQGRPWLVNIHRRKQGAEPLLRIDMLKDGQYLPAAKEFPRLKNLKTNYLVRDEKYDRLLIVTEDEYKILAFRDSSLTELSGEPLYSRPAFNRAHSDANAVVFRALNADSLPTYYRVEEGAYTALLTDTEVRGGFFLDEKRGDFWYVRKDVLTRYTLSDRTHHAYPNIRMESNSAIYVDGSGMVWLGLENGLIQFFGEIFENYLDERFSGIYGIVEDEEGAIWFCGFNSGLWKIEDGKPRKITQYERVTPDDGFYPRPLLTWDGKLLFSVGGGLIAHKDDRFYYFDQKDSLGRATSLYLYEDRERDLILSATYKGVRILHPDGRREFYTVEDSTYRTTFLISIEKDTAGHYWLGSHYGLTRFDYESKEMYSYSYRKGNLPFMKAMSLHTDYRGTLWVGGDRGVWSYVPERDTFRRHFASDIDYVNQMTVIAERYLLVNNVKGIWLFDLNAYYEEGVERVHYFNDLTGLLGEDPYMNAVFEDSRGDVWMGFSNGVVRMDPDNMVFDRYPPKARVVRVNREAIPFASDTGPYELPYGRNDLTLDLEAIGFHRPQDTEYSYRLLGLNDEWSLWNRASSLVYTNLASGAYTFESRAYGFGFSEEELPVERVELEVALPIYREPWFYRLAAALLGLLLIVLLIVGWLWRQARRRNEKMRLLQKAKELEAQYMRLLSLQSQMNPHFVFNILGAIQNQILIGNQRKANDYLVKLSKLMRQVLEASVEASGTGTELSPNEVSLESEIDLLQTYIHFEQLLHEGSFEYEIELGPDCDPAQETLPSMLVQPYVENAIKHGLQYKSGPGRLYLFFFRENGELVCRITDDGVGREKAREIQAHRRSSHRSRGTQLTQERIDILNEIGYDIAVDTRDREEGGTEVYLVRYEGTDYWTELYAPFV